MRYKCLFFADRLGTVHYQGSRLLLLRPLFSRAEEKNTHGWQFRWHNILICRTVNKPERIKAGPRFYGGQIT